MADEIGIGYQQVLSWDRIAVGGRGPDLDPSPRMQVALSAAVNPRSEPRSGPVAAVDKSAPIWEQGGRNPLTSLIPGRKRP